MGAPLGAVLAAAVLAGAAACGGPRTAAPQAPVEPPLGRWAVDAVLTPGLHGMEPAEIAERRSWAAVLEPARASFGPDRCEEASYALRTVDADALLVEHRLPSGDPELGLPPGPLTEVRITCSRGAFQRSGGLFYATSDGRLFSPWDGAWHRLVPAQ